jgi:hypothetical protein
MRSLIATAAIVLLGLPAARAVQEPPKKPPAPAEPSAPGVNPANPEPPAGAPAGQEAKQRSKALEDLLRQLQTHPESRRVAAPAAHAGAEEPQAATSPANEKSIVRLTRMSDLVQLVHLGLQRDLAFWDKSVELAPGDEVRQGAKAVTILDYADGANCRFDGPATYRLTSDGAASPRLLEIERIARFAQFTLGQGDVDTVLTLPGGNELAGRHALVTVRDFDQRAIELRNAGPEPVVLRSPYLGATLLTLNVGQKVTLPVLPEPSAFVPRLTHDASTGDAARGTLLVEAQPEIALRTVGDSVELRGDGPIPAIARANGARVVLRPGEQLTLARVPLGDPRRKESEH